MNFPSEPVREIWEPPLSIAMCDGPNAREDRHYGDAPMRVASTKASVAIDCPAGTAARRMNIEIAAVYLSGARFRGLGRQRDLVRDRLCMVGKQ